MKALGVLLIALLLTLLRQSAVEAKPVNYDTTIHPRHKSRGHRKTLKTLEDEYPVLLQPKQPMRRPSYNSLRAVNPHRIPMLALRPPHLQPGPLAPGNRPMTIPVLLIPTGSNQAPPAADASHRSPYLDSVELHMVADAIAKAIVEKSQAEALVELAGEGNGLATALLSKAGNHNKADHVDVSTKPSNNHQAAGSSAATTNTVTLVAPAAKPQAQPAPAPSPATTAAPTPAPAASPPPTSAQQPVALAQPASPSPLSPPPSPSSLPAAAPVPIPAPAPQAVPMQAPQAQPPAQPVQQLLAPASPMIPVSPDMNIQAAPQMAQMQQPVPVAPPSLLAPANPALLAPPNGPPAAIPLLNFAAPPAGTRAFRPSRP
ncbi:hypothetical protein GQ42DRAFT_158036 [Ramicandelaber brevisporus]|nr:hypothetical protein GQ42DRAFT_158036 [Ramicandelaber brevisporus]